MFETGCLDLEQWLFQICSNRQMIYKRGKYGMPDAECVKSRPGHTVSSIFQPQ